MTCFSARNLIKVAGFGFKPNFVTRLPTFKLMVSTTYALRATITTILEGPAKKRSKSAEK